MKFTNKVLYYLLFTELSPNQARCNTCLKVTKSGNGYTNQFHHLLKRHPDNQELAAAAFRKGNPNMRWVEWYVMDRMPVSYCERPLVCKNAKMQPISAATLQKFLDALYGHVREVIATTLPDKFVIALDALTTAEAAESNYDEGIQCARRAFDWVGRQYPAFEARLAADIVNYPALESGIIKIISGSCLTTREQEAYKAFKRPATNGTVEETSRSFLAPVFQKALEPRTSYIPLA
ncbi:Zinc finger, BED-type [Phytophthora cactorum]|nr:Zinc finger, BED-type [Phytophthora cactorum]